MRVLNVNDTLDLKSGGGTAERTFQMSRFIANEEIECMVLVVDSQSLDIKRIDELKPAKITILPCVIKRFKFPKISWELIRRLVREADIVHLMGHWSVLNVLVYFAIRIEKKPYVVCPAGALHIFGRSKFLKYCYNLIIGYSIIRNATCWIAVTEGEFQYFEKYGIPKEKVVVIPNGVSEDDFPVVALEDFKKHFSLPDVPVILFMGRLNPIKGPDLLLQAFISARSAFPTFHLVFAGPDEGMGVSLKETVDKAGLNNLVHYIGFVTGMEKSAIYRIASLLVVPSRQEAMSIVAIEAGVCGTPVLLTDQCGFKQISLIDHRLEVPATSNGIADGLIKLLGDPITLKKILPSWISFVRKNYTWKKIVPRYIELYRNILDSNSCR